MKLLILTQKVDMDDPVLGFFHRWIEEFSKHFESLIVVCLEKGRYELPDNVQVFSLGKEKYNLTPYSLPLTPYIKLKYLFTFYYLIFTLRKQYDSVFVHMNQEYVLLAGDIWRLWGKKVYLWRNHAKGNIFTRLAVALSHKVFYTSPQSYTARFNSPRRSLWCSAGKSVQMPVGIDTDFFKPNPAVERKPNSVLFLGRIAPVKRVLEFVEWFSTLGPEFTATVAGAALPKDKEYEKSLKLKVKSLKLEGRVKFVGPVTQDGALKLYQTHEIYVNKTPAGSFDKTIIEATAAGCRVIADNPAARNIKAEDHSLDRLADKLAQHLV